MDNLLLQWSPIIIVLVMFLIQNRIFVTPEQLEKKHREILEDAENKFVVIKQYQEMKESIKEQYTDVKDSIDKIFDLLRVQK